MPIDFTQIENGEDFELLCEDLLRAMGFTIFQKAARGIDGRLYPWGELFDLVCCNSGNDFIDTATSVGCYPPWGDSPCNCADVAGNGWEWTTGRFCGDHRPQFRVLAAESRCSSWLQERNMFGTNRKRRIALGAPYTSLSAQHWWNSIYTVAILCTGEKT